MSRIIKLYDVGVMMITTGKNKFLFPLICGLCFTFVLAALDSHGASRPRNRGILLSVESEGTQNVHYSILKGTHLYIPKGTSPHHMVKPGPFSLKVSGILRVPIRAEYAFSLHASPGVQFVFESEILLETTGSENHVQTEMKQLDKGYMEFEILMTGDSTKRDHFFRLNWGDVETPMAPFAYRSMGFNIASADKKILQEHESALLGKSLFFENRCFKCHTDNTVDYDASGDWLLDAPAFHGIGSRREAGFMAAWIHDPKAVRSSASMPKVFHGEQSEENAQAIAAYLSTLKDDSQYTESTQAESQLGSQVFDKLLCSSCHEKPGGDSIHIDEDLPRFSLNHVSGKYSPGALEAFLKNPSKHYSSIRMPDFGLSDKEAGNLAAFLISAKEQKSFAGFPVNDDLISKGKKLISSSGCMSCHTGPDKNTFMTPSISKLANLGSGCLDPNQGNSEVSIRYSLDDDDKEALASFIKSSNQSLYTRVPYAEIHRRMDHLQCAHCHGEHDGFPSLDLMTGKLNPSWASKFISGKAGYKSRPWLESRMPSFEFYAENVAQGMASAGGFSPHSNNEFVVDSEKAEIGRKLVSTGEGFACNTCHDVGINKATAVFEAPGINLAYSGDRLQQEFYTRWLLHPLKVDRNSKMPVYFDKGKSPLDKYFEGDAYKQVEAVWHYLKLGEQMPAPESPKKETAEPEEEFE